MEIGKNTDSVRQAVRMSDIARLAGVSRLTVSKVLTGSDTRNNTRVSQATSEKIIQLARDMNYQPNYVARQLAGKSSRVLGILIDSQASGVIFRLLACLEHEATLRGYRTLVGEAHDSAENLFANYTVLKQHGVDGVICLMLDYPSHNQKIAEFFSKEPNLVFVRTPADTGRLHVNLDIAGGIRTAITALQTSGRKRIAMLLTSTASGSVQERHTGFISALPGRENWIFEVPPTEDITALRQALHHLAEHEFRTRHFDAVITLNDYMAIAMIGELQRSGLCVPEDVAVIGHDNEFFGQCLLQTLSSIDQNEGEMASAALEMLLAEIEGRPHPDTVTIMPTLQWRESC